MCEICNNRENNCPACSPLPEPEPEIQTVTHNPKHCADCRFSIYYNAKWFEQYDCNHPMHEAPVMALKSFHDEPLGVDEKPLPDECPLRKYRTVIEL